MLEGYLHTDLPFDQLTATPKNGLQVMFPDTQTGAQAKHTAVLKNLTLLIEAKTVHFFNHLASGNLLLALGPPWDAGCIAYFDKDTCCVTSRTKVKLY